MNLYQELINSANEFKFKHSLYYFNSKTNMKKFVKHIDILSNYFKENKIKKNSSYTIYMPNSIQAFAVFYALNKIGAIANIVHPLTPISTLEESIKETKSKGIIVLDILANKQIDAINNLETKVLVAKNSDYINGIKKLFFKLFELVKANKIKYIKNKINYKQAIKKYRKYEITQKTVKNDVATYIHSGGTSGKSKTIVLTNKSITTLSNEVSKFNKRKGKEFSPIVLPIFHAYGLAVGVHSLLKLGYNGFIFPQFNAKKINKVMQKHKVTTLISVPLMISKMMDQKHFYGKHLKRLSRVYCGGDVVTNQLQSRFNHAVESYGGTAKLFAGYGLTETSSVVSVNTIENYKFGSVGKPINNVDIQIWGDDEKTYPPMSIGEIAISGDVLMQGYLDQKDTGITIKNGKKFVKTGDLGYFDEEGFLFICGRKKRLIKIASYNIFPSEIEETILKLPYISEVCAFEKVVDSKTTIKVVVSLKKGFDYESKKQLSKEIIAHCADNLIKYSVPSEVEIIKQLPHTKMSKIDFVKIEQVYLNENEAFVN